MHPAATETPPAPRRVREQAREAAVLMAFSAFTSVALATALLRPRPPRAAGLTMDSPSHVPVLLDRVVALLAPSLERRGRRHGRRHPRPRRPHRGGADPLRAGPGDRHRPRPGRAGAWPASGWPASATGSPACTRSTTSCPTSSTSSASTRSTRSSSTSASPRCSSTSASAASPTPRTRRSTCAWTAPPARPPPTCSTPTRPRS